MLPIGYMKTGLIIVTAVLSIVFVCKQAKVRIQETGYRTVHSIHTVPGPGAVSTSRQWPPQAGAGEGQVQHAKISPNPGTAFTGCL